MSADNRSLQATTYIYCGSWIMTYQQEYWQNTSAHYICWLLYMCTVMQYNILLLSNFSFSFKITHNSCQNMSLHKWISFKDKNTQRSTLCHNTYTNHISLQRAKATCKWRRCGCSRRFDRSWQSVLVCWQWYEKCKRYQPHTDCEESQHLTV